MLRVFFPTSAATPPPAKGTRETWSEQDGGFGILPPCPGPALQGVRQDLGREPEPAVPSLGAARAVPRSVDGSKIQMKGSRYAPACLCVCVLRVYKSVPRAGNLLRLLDLREVAFLLYSQITQL